MADCTLTGNARRFKERNRYVYEGTALFPGTALTCTLPLPSFVKVRRVIVNGTGATATAMTSYAQTSPGLTSASAKFQQYANSTGSISALEFSVTTTVATDATNIWTVGVINQTATLTPASIATAANSNNSTGGSAFTAYTKFALTLGVAAQLLVTLGDVLEWTFTKASSAANLVGLGLRTSIAATGTTANESLYGPTPNATSGFIDISSNRITIGRVAPNPTNNLPFQFTVEGY